MYLPGDVPVSGCICQGGEVLRTGGKESPSGRWNRHRRSARRIYMTNFNDAETTSLYISAAAAPWRPKLKRRTRKCSR